MRCPRDKRGRIGSDRPVHSETTATVTRLSQKSLRAGLEDVAARDSHVADALSLVGFPKLRRRKPGFEALFRAIVGQQVSIQAAAAIWARVQAAVDPMAPETVLALDDEALRGAGLSRQKVAYARHLSEMVASRTVRLDRLPRLADEDAIAELVQVKGIGRWSAEVYLLFALGRADMWPVDDLALMIAAQRMKRLEARPNRKAMLEIGEAWRPWRGAVAHLLWHYYANAPAPETPNEAVTTKGRKKT